MKKISPQEDFGANVLKGNMIATRTARMKRNKKYVSISLWNSAFIWNYPVCLSILKHVPAEYATNTFVPFQKQRYEIFSAVVLVSLQTTQNLVIHINTKRFYYLVPNVSYQSKHVKYNLYYLCIIIINRSYSLFINLLARQIHLSNEEKETFF